MKRPAKERPRERILWDGSVLRDMARPRPQRDRRAGRRAGGQDAPGPDRGTRAALLLGLAARLRAGEIAALEWSAVRLDDAPPALSIIAGKTEAASRTLPLPAQAVAILRALKAHAERGAKYVFPARADAARAEHLHPESLSRAFSRLCVALGIEGATLHDLRRTAALGHTSNSPATMRWRNALLGHAGQINARPPLRQVEAFGFDAGGAAGVGGRR